MRSAAIYARISSDIEGTGLGAARQVQDCRTLAASLGWSVGEEYEDNDLSAYSVKRRPAYERMLADLRDGERDAVLVYHVDRLTRRPLELEEFLQALNTARVRHVRVVVDDTDLSTGDGLMVVRMLAAMAANESETKSRRVKRKLEQNAVTGLPHGGNRRPFGYDRTKMIVVEDEAEVIRQLVARFLAGESTRSLATWLNKSEIASVSGQQWRTPTVTAIVTSGRIAGLRRHRGEIIGPAAWPAIITEDDHHRALAMQQQKTLSGRRSPRRYLLSGMLHCGKCGSMLYSAARATTRRYVCLSGPDHGGCGRLTVVAAPVEDLIARGVLFRLDTPELADALAGRAAHDQQLTAVTDALAADLAQQNELDSGHGKLPGDGHLAARWRT